MASYLLSAAVGNKVANTGQTHDEDEDENNGPKSGLVLERFIFSKALQELGEIDRGR